MPSTLKIYIRFHCTGCAEAQDTAVHIEKTYPHLAVEVVDMDNPTSTIPDNVFATPTYVLDNKVMSLGNPDYRDIAEWLSE